VGLVKFPVGACNGENLTTTLVVRAASKSQVFFLQAEEFA
jgi:hypothetical protein